MEEFYANGGAEPAGDKFAAVGGIPEVPPGAVDGVVGGGAGVDFSDAGAYFGGLEFESPIPPELDVEGYGEADLYGGDTEDWWFGPDVSDAGEVDGGADVDPIFVLGGMYWDADDVSGFIAGAGFDSDDDADTVDGGCDACGGLGDAIAGDEAAGDAGDAGDALVAGLGEFYATGGDSDDDASEDAPEDAPEDGPEDAPAESDSDSDSDAVKRRVAEDAAATEADADGAPDGAAVSSDGGGIGSFLGGGDADSGDDGIGSFLGGGARPGDSELDEFLADYEDLEDVDGGGFAASAAARKALLNPRDGSAAKPRRVPKPKRAARA